MLPDEILKILSKHKFVTVATSSAKARPNAAPKFLLDVQGDNIYVVDYYINRTWRNLKVNPKVALALFDDRSLNGYQIRGVGKILYSGDEYDRLKKILDEKAYRFSAERVIQAVRSGSRSGTYEISMPNRIVILKIKVDEISIFGLTGKVKRETIGKIQVVVEKKALETEIPIETIPLLLPQTLDAVYKDLTTIDPEEPESLNMDVPAD